ncbi:MAG: HNH endonuclease signature motif containing protein [Nocardioides sp.]|uniref:HNH endonuclease n=1 Tax=Nocardioides sp. TaxID=35761 RepID=UPI0039E2AF0F
MWYDEALKHPDGRANNREPCIKCGSPIPPSTHFKHRDRHLCSTRCNTNFKRQWKRAVQKAIDDGSWDPASLKRPAPVPNPRTSGPRDFRMIPGGRPPFAFEGFGVIEGDLVERHGIEVIYAIAERADNHPDWWSPHLLVAEEVQTRHFQVWGAQLDGRLAAVCYGSFSPEGEMLDTDQFEVAGLRVKWWTEFVTDVAPDGRDYRWEAIVAAPIDSDYTNAWWTDARQELSDRRRRISQSSARHERRVRLAGAISERFDPIEVFERDAWVCGICGRPVDKTLLWPDPMSPSLDHIRPLVANGEHSRENTQLGHLICNISKGGQFETSEV